MLIGQRESRVTEAVAKAVERSEKLVLVSPVTVGECDGFADRFAVIVKRNLTGRTRDGHGQLAGRISLAEEDARDGRAGLSAEATGMKDGASVGFGGGRRQVASRAVHDHQRQSEISERGDQLLLSRRQRKFGNGLVLTVSRITLTDA